MYEFKRLDEKKQSELRERHRILNEKEVKKKMKKLNKTKRKEEWRKHLSAIENIDLLFECGFSSED